jgi:pseudaminic acid synthase
MTNLIFRRSIYANQDIKKGETITKNEVMNLRPLLGIHANCLYRILGKKLKKNIRKGSPINNSLFK